MEESNEENGVKVEVNRRAYGMLLMKLKKGDLGQVCKAISGK